MCQGRIYLQCAGGAGIVDTQALLNSAGYSGAYEGPLDTQKRMGVALEVTLAFLVRLSVQRPRRHAARLSVDDEGPGALRRSGAPERRY